MRIAVLCALLVSASFAAITSTAIATYAADPADIYNIEWDRFRGPFDATSPTAPWFYFNAGPAFVGNGGIETTRDGRLRVRANGINPATGQPAFTNTVAPESQSGLPGGLDHVKWLVYTNHLASTGIPGFDAVPGRVLSCEANVGGRTYGTNQHLFGSAVQNPQSDMRLASFALNSIDFETFMVFDFFITNETVYAFYERLPFGRGPVLGRYASFSHAIPVRRRRGLDETYRLRISYDRSAGTVSWYIDGDRVLQVSRLGFRLDRRLITLDHGGTEGPVEMRQMACGMGLFTLLDAYRPTDIGLVKLSDAPNFYFDPSVGEPTPSPFVDSMSQPSSRLFGQGAEIRVEDFRVSSRPR